MPPQHLTLNACRMALRLSGLQIAAVGRISVAPSGIEGDDYQQIGDKKR
ncbi:hypothetical protein I9216_003146 [Citrobacter koseri]|nr:hypothetical protein [Citrobacter koseri]HEM8689624.1 hypothetical protein [Citrobacter koseri]